MSFYHQEKCTSALKSPIWLHFIQKKFIRLYHSQDDKKRQAFHNGDPRIKCLGLVSIL